MHGHMNVKIVVEVLMKQNLQICLAEFLEVMETAATSTESEIQHCLYQ
jgi:hypothetical protein